jgi:predicted S18 family serine protease
MATKKAKKRDPNTLDVESKNGEAHEIAVAKTSLRPTVQAASTIKHYNKALFGELDLMGLIEELSSQIKTTTDGNLGRGEAMLVAQAHTLDAMFNKLARKAANVEYLNQAETYLKMSLRAQSQCRSTWEAVSAIKNPPIAYVKQANIAQIQQINNAAPRMEEKEIPQNELLEQTQYERMDTGTQGATITDGSAMATLGEVNGAKKP